MAHCLYQLKQQIGYRFKARHYKGFGIHSPYLYHLITSELQGKHPYYSFERIESVRKELNINQNKKEVHCGQIIFRIIQDAQFMTLLELGTNRGMETQYMAMANQKARCISVTNSAELAVQAQKGFQKQGLNHIDLQLLKPQEKLTGIINQLDKLDFVLFNQLNGAQECLDLFHQCLLRKNDGSIFVFMDIHENGDKTKAWKNILSNHDVQVTIDLYHLGIVLFKPELEKRNYVI
ncbi:MAG: hypothetical protein PHS30_05110 [Bacteroidales bacterium]|nr:hypothetical protein [Bacteroidales bacterium]